jgi:hypothetical protein
MIGEYRFISKSLNGNQSLNIFCSWYNESSISKYLRLGTKRRTGTYSDFGT